ncbi:MAG: hypothetical protein M0Q91_18655 [Methanoregula sp.]|jgi:fructose-specific phosphotransferase system IIC component|nr:hypothetical protein [Methanoregula sp.]
MQSVGLYAGLLIGILGGFLGSLAASFLQAWITSPAPLNGIPTAVGFFGFFVAIYLLGWDLWKAWRREKMVFDPEE